MCEAWWKGNLLEREVLLPNTIMYIIGQSLSTTKVRGREGEMEEGRAVGRERGQEGEEREREREREGVSEREREREGGGGGGSEEERERKAFI